MEPLGIFVVALLVFLVFLLCMFWVMGLHQLIREPSKKHIIQEAKELADIIIGVIEKHIIVTQSEKKEKDYRALSIEIISSITPDLNALANEEMIYKIIAILQREDLNG